MRSILSSVGAVAVCLVAGSAFANSTGITGRSGKQNGLSCTASGCHGGGSSTPTVTLEGPTALSAGQTGQYSLIITGGPGVKAGMNVAVDGATLTAGSGSKVVAGELTHSLPKGFTDGSARFDFSLVAPATNGTYKVFAAGNSVNGNNSESGDAHANATLEVVVTGGSDPAPIKEDDGGGCSAATSGAPAVLIAVFAALASRRRRQSRQG
jgi:MYXO-CTERM domain-containing protein